MLIKGRCPKLGNVTPKFICFVSLNWDVLVVRLNRVVLADLYLDFPYLFLKATCINW